MTRKFDSTTGPILSDVDHIVHAIAAHFRGRRATPEAVLWPNAQDLMHRFHALTRAIEWANFSDNSRLHLLDLGCGPGFLLDYLEKLGVLNKVAYTGTDLNPDVLSIARSRWPDQTFQLRDVRREPFEPRIFDVAVLCGVFTAKFTLDQPAMIRLMEDTLSATWPSVRGYLGYNVMSKHVDWERQDLFHYRIDDAIAFAWRGLKTRNVRILHDYGLYEYSCLIFRDAIRSDLPVPNTCG